MTQQHTVIYIPGLGDTNIQNRQKMLKIWHYRHMEITTHTMNWQVDEPWQDKLDGLLNDIDTYTAAGKTVSLIGESAGASAAMQALQLRTTSLNAVILLCGKTQYPDRLGAHVRRKNPQLYESVSSSHAYIQKMPKSDKKKVLNMHPIIDPVVPVHETEINGVQNARLPSFGHAASIIFAMIFWNFRMVHFIRKDKRSAA